MSKNSFTFLVQLCAIIPTEWQRCKCISLSQYGVTRMFTELVLVQRESFRNRVQYPVFQGKGEAHNWPSGPLVFPARGAIRSKIRKARGGSGARHLAHRPRDRSNRKPVGPLVFRGLASVGHMCLAYRSSVERAPSKMRRVYVIRGNAMPRRYW